MAPDCEGAEGGGDGCGGNELAFDDEEDGSGGQDREGSDAIGADQGGGYGDAGGEEGDAKRVPGEAGEDKGEVVVCLAALGAHPRPLPITGGEDGRQPPCP